MRNFITLAFACTVAQAAFRNEQNDWHSFKANHSKFYSSAEEEEFRMKIFLNNKNMIEEHNKRYSQGRVTFHLAVNYLADLTSEEIGQRFNRLLSESNFIGDSYVYNGGDLPETVDWRKKGAVTPVKRQGTCGACWAFAVTGSIEAQYFLKTGKLISLSEQQLIDCSSTYGNKGCQEGLMVNGYDYIKYSGIESEEDYPYADKQGKCNHDGTRSIARISRYVRIAKNEEALKKAVATVGPVAVGIVTNNTAFSFYKGGVYNEPNGEGRHAVLVVGYGTENGQDYWLVKNSWGANWGDEGYIKMSRNKNNQCQIASSALYPIVQCKSCNQNA